MSKPYDVTMKQILEEYAADWVEWLAQQIGLPACTHVESLDVDLSALQLTADKVYQLHPKEEGLVHLELQSSSEKGMPQRMLIYNSHLEARYNQPVHSVLILLSRAAEASTITGLLTRSYANGVTYKQFRYDVIRVWKLPGRELLEGSWGLVPLALLTDDASGHLKEWVNAIDQRGRAESLTVTTLSMMLFSSFMLLGLRYNKEQILEAFAENTIMKESSAYQLILETGKREGIQEGRQEGRQEGLQEGRKEGLHEGRKEGLQEGRQEGLHEGRKEGLQEALTKVLASRFGPLPQDLVARIQSTTDIEVLDKALLNAIQMSSLCDLQL